MKGGRWVGGCEGEMRGCIERACCKKYVERLVSFQRVG